MIDISLLQKGDIETMKEVVAVNDVFATESQHYSELNYNSQKFLETISLFAEDGYGCVVARIDGKVVGYSPFMLDTRYIDKINFEIMTLYVLPEYRNSGVGGIMADYLIKLIAVHNASYAQISICANFKTNRDLIQRATERLFKQRGFDIIGTVLGRKS